MRTDPATLEIMRSYYNAIASGMGHIIERTSFTTFVKESADFATALAAPSGEFYVYPKTVGVTIFLGLSVAKAVESVGPLEEGDIVITNDPYTTDGLATHLPDVHVFKPVFSNGELISYAWAFVHCSDVGGLVPSSISPEATDIHQEGLRIPPVKLYRRGERSEDVYTFLNANSRVPQLNEGDVHAMVAAVNTAEQRLLGLVGKFGEQAVKDSIEDLMDQGEERARKVIRQIPDGTYTFADYLDDDMLSDTPVRLAVDVIVDDGSITLDFTKCDPQVRTAFNLVTNGKKHSFLYQGLINYMISEDPFIPANGAITRPISVISPVGTLVNPVYPAAVGVRHTITMRMYNVVLGALAQAIPERVPAAGAGQSAIVVLSTPDADTGTRNMAVVQPMGGGGGGGGGQSDMDGADGIDHASGFLKNTPIESLEQHIDILVKRYEFLPDTAGAGLSRGGQAIRLDFEIVRENSIVTARGMERLRFHPWGLAGGTAGSLGRVVLNPGTPQERQLPKISVLHPQPGDVVSILSPGGGGWGDPLLRHPSRVASDVAAGLIAPDAALAQYGVALVRAGADWDVDAAATEAERGRLAAERDARPGSGGKPELGITPSQEAGGAAGSADREGGENAGTVRLTEGSASARTADDTESSAPETRIDFGPARIAYEAVWTPEASDELARLLYELPPTQRAARKQRVHERAAELYPEDALDADKVRAVWAEFAAAASAGSRL
ncbi:hydantoinase B/oxoprolinase family protein [Saccharibacillus sp. CPCC 101409]|uniref:hydantoinase B/oxoprolinase family protein n=1 Tax=Saccharibacillus sp. CPCC 101409 TaxID=3058041 RepID=UPI002671C528|nr:hydantoinase B/oxoprolinase family protein [Saccharibacillus sp. CPCC 101409]MDO3408203.1 hydantoinase B/oxoprolinase family protein [Saccharibacillus sp. CPCC 101409]